MRRRLALAIGLACLGISLALGSGCATLREMDPSLLNHPAMDLHRPLAVERVSYLSPLGNVSEGARTGGACTACAH